MGRISPGGGDQLSFQFGEIHSAAILETPCLRAGLQIFLFSNPGQQFPHFRPGPESTHFDQRHGPARDMGDFLDRALLDFKQGDDYVAGALQIEPTMMKPQWNVYFTVDDVDETASLAKKLGGKVFFDLLDIPNVGRMCGISSPQGVPFYTMSR